MDRFMRAACEEAVTGRCEGGIPIGAVLVHRGNIIGRGRNRRMQQSSSVLHAEIDALAAAGRQPVAVYRECMLYTTLSPCAMCAGAILLFKIPEVVIGEAVNFPGEPELLRSRGVKVTILEEPKLIAMMKQFIEENPAVWNEDIAT